MVSTFTIGQLVRVNDASALSHGRYGHILSLCASRAEVEFADLLGVAAVIPPVHTFEQSQLEAVTDIPVASFYLLVTVLTLVGTQEYTRYEIAHGVAGESAAAVAENIAARFFGSLGDYDGEYYLWPGTPYAAKLEKSELITVAQYAELRRTTPDYCMGVEAAV